MKKYLVPIVLLILGAVFYVGYRNYGELFKLFFFKPEPMIDGALRVPDGFKIEVYAENLPSARVIAVDMFGNLWVSQMREGKVSLLSRDSDGKIIAGTILQDLKNPHGLAFHPDHAFKLFIAEEHQIISLPTYSDGGPEFVAPLSGGGSHVSRTIGFGPDKRLYVSIGSTCNVCNEKDIRRAAILRGGSNGEDLSVFAKGLRNTVFFTWRDDGKMFGADMGRDYLGDDLPPDEINILKEGNFGWPICYGKNIHDSEFDKNVYIRNPCMEPFEIGSYIDIPAHSAPLGLAFIPKNSQWPKEYWGDLLVAYHGSWNRSVPTGYKVVRYEFDDKGEYTGKVSDFVTGFLTASGEVLGRPVDIKVSPEGFAYISDDYAGVIYKIKYAD
jgi:glucose/arabinose dehydrogenase